MRSVQFGLEDIPDRKQERMYYSTLKVLNEQVNGQSPLLTSVQKMTSGNSGLPIEARSRMEQHDNHS